MEIRRIPVSRLNPAAYNPRKNLQPGDPEYQKLVRSLDKFGCVEPVVWNQRTGSVVGGHQRLKVLIAAGETEVDVSVVDLCEADEKALNIALNKISGEWDTSALTELLQELSADASIDELLTGFDQAEFDALLSDLESRAAEKPSMDADPYVDGFFESGVQAKQPVRPQTPADAGGEQDQHSESWGVTVYGLSWDELEMLTAYLEDKGFSYRTQQTGGVGSD